MKIDFILAGKFTELSGKLTQDSTLGELRAAIQEARKSHNSVYLWYHLGDEIRYDDSLTLCKVFGENSPTVEVDFASHELGPVKVVCELKTKPAMILDTDLTAKEIKPGCDEDVFLSRKRYFVSII